MKILYFAYLVDKLGRASETLALPVEVRTAGELLGLLRGRGDTWTRALAEDRVQILVNRKFATADTAICESDEVAFVSNAPG
jgi:molybdopterin synthase sulfur carrier subunit